MKKAIPRTPTRILTDHLSEAKGGADDARAVIIDIGDQAPDDARAEIIDIGSPAA